jgi:hypothetical protein
MIPPVDVPATRLKSSDIGRPVVCSMNLRMMQGITPRIPPPSMERIRNFGLLMEKGLFIQIKIFLNQFN